MEWASRRGDLPPDVSGANPASIGKEIERATGEGYDLVVVDTAPHADHAALQAARAADLVAIPCRPSTFDIAAISATLDLCKLANKQAVVVLIGAGPEARSVALVGSGCSIFWSRRTRKCPVRSGPMRDKAA
jgi:chromosome partitioning protein